MRIRVLRSSDLADIRRILAGLHHRWFDDNALKHIPLDLHFQKTFVAVENGAVVGFICVRSQDGEPMIGWLGVDVNRHHQGIGTRLIERAEREVKKWGGGVLRVETVVEQHPPDGTYDLTMQFYAARGYSVESRSEQKTAGEFIYRMGILVKSLDESRPV